MVKKCSWGRCKSDSRNYGKKPEMEGVTFIPFPKPKNQKEKCLRWIKLCGRCCFEFCPGRCLRWFRAMTW